MKALWLWFQAWRKKEMCPHRMYPLLDRVGQPVVAYRCIRMKYHPGKHANGEHQWS